MQLLKRRQHFQMIQCACLSTSLPQSLRENHVSLKAFMPFQKFRSSCCLQSESSLNCEVSGRERWFRGWSQSQRQARGQSIMKHTNTQLCVDSLPLFLPIHHNRPLIPLRSAHQGQTVPIQWHSRIWWNQTAE